MAVGFAVFCIVAFVVFLIVVNFFDPEERRERERADWEKDRKSRERQERQEQFKHEAGRATRERRLALEVQEKVRRLAQVQGGSPKKILIAELQLAEAEAELEYFANAPSMAKEQQEVFLDKIAALREQIKEEEAKP